MRSEEELKKALTSVCDQIVRYIKKSHACELRPRMHHIILEDRAALLSWVLKIQNPMGVELREDWWKDGAS